jgi:hypothetical protein
MVVPVKLRPWSPVGLKHNTVGSVVLTARSAHAHWPGCKPDEAGPLLLEKLTKAISIDAIANSTLFIWPIWQVNG